MLLLKGFLLFIIVTELRAVHLLLSWTSSVKLVDDVDISNITDLSASSSVIALDYHYDRGEFYFSDGSGTIQRGWLRRPRLNSKPLVIAEVKLCDGLAVDWVHDNLYWTDITRHSVEMATLDGLHRKVLFNSSHGLERPRAIVLDPSTGLLFWSDWGDFARIDSSGLDGKMRRSIVSSDLIWPNGLALDLDNRKLFILDGLLSTISSCSYDGSDRMTILQSENMLKQAFGLSYYGNKVYWDSWRTHSVYAFDNLSGNTQTVLKRRGWRVVAERMMGMKAVHPSLQKSMSVPDPCATVKCSHMCLLGSGPSASCVCPYGFTLQSDGKTCVEEGYLLVSWRGTIRRYTLHGEQEEPMYDSSKAAIALDYHYSKGLVFWSDIDENQIYRAPLDQLNNKSAVAVTETCDGLAVDWVHDVLYWTDTAHNTLEASRLDGTERKVLISQDLDQPRAIAVDPHSDFIFWSDWGHNAKIERAALDGSERTVIVSDDLHWPNGITLDIEHKLIYWVDGSSSTISSISYEGTRRERILGRSAVTSQPFAISLFQDFIYWTDWKTMSLYKANKTDMVEAVKLANVSIILLRPNGVKVVHSSLQRESSNPCASVNCRGLCVGSSTATSSFRCLGEIVEPQMPEDSSGEESFKVIKKPFNDSIQLSTNSSSKLALVVVSVKCVKRLHCKEDKRCSDLPERKELFMNKDNFTISGLLPATQYDLSFTAPKFYEHFTVDTLARNPPETPKQLTAEVEGTKVTVKWAPVDICIPDFQHYNYKLFLEKLNGAEDSQSETIETYTNKTEVTFENLRPKSEYTIQIYTTDESTFSKIKFSTNEAEVDVEDLVVYKKSRYEVFFRAEVKNKTRKELDKFVGTYFTKSDGQNTTITFEKKAEPCAIWPDSFCFSISPLDYNKTYEFTVSATWKNGNVSQRRVLSATTKEGESSPPDVLNVVKLLPTSVELQWSHPRQSNGIVRNFLINIVEVDTTDKEKCCQSFPFIEIPVKAEEPYYNVETGGLLPASTYSISVLVKTLYIGGTKSIDVHTPPDSMDILKEPPQIHIPSQASLEWLPRDNSYTDESVYHDLVRLYMLLVLPQNDSEPIIQFKTATSSDVEEFKPLLESNFGLDFTVLWTKSKEEHTGGEEPVDVNGLISGHQYQLVWLQVAEYKGAYSLDYMTSHPFTAA